MSTSQTPDKRLLELRALALGRRIDGSDTEQLRQEIAGVIEELIALRSSSDALVSVLKDAGQLLDDCEGHFRMLSDENLFIWPNHPLNPQTRIAAMQKRILEMLP